MTTTGQSTRISADRVWAAYYQSLIQTVAGSVDPATQVVSLAERACATDLGNPDPAIAANYIFETGNALPAWNPESAPPEGLLCSYAAFLDNIDLGEIADTGLRSRLDAARANYHTANKNFAAVRSHAVSAWIESRQIEPPIDFSAFVKCHFPLYTLAGQALRGADSDFEALMFQAYGPEYSAIADARSKCGISSGAAATDMPTPYNMAVKKCASSIAPVNYLPGASPHPAHDRPFPTYAPAFRLDGFAAAYAEWQSNSSNGLTIETITIAGNTLANQWADQPWPPAGGKFRGDFFKIDVSDSISGIPQPINTLTSDFSVSIGFAGLDTFSISPGEWYDGRIVQAYKNRLLPTAPPLFGEGGGMALLPTAVIVGFQPSIVITLARSDYARIKNRTYSAASINIGPFTIGNGFDRILADKTALGFDDLSSTITIRQSKKPLPLLLGVVSTKL